MLAPHLPSQQGQRLGHKGSIPAWVGCLWRSRPEPPSSAFSGSGTSTFTGWLKTNLEPTTISSRNSENSKNPRTAQRGTRKITAGGSLQVQWSGGSLKEKNMAESGVRKQASPLGVKVSWHIGNALA